MFVSDWSNGTVNVDLLANESKCHGQEPPKGNAPSVGKTRGQWFPRAVPLKGNLL